MKKFVLGITFFVTGFLGVMILLEPFYNESTPSLYYLFSSKRIIMFIISTLLFFYGFRIITNEVYGETIFSKVIRYIKRKNKELENYFDSL